MALNARDQFLQQHATFASLLAGSDAKALRTFEQNHPQIIAQWNQLTTPTAAAPAVTPAAPAPVAATPSPAAATSASDLSAGALVSQFLDSYGLGGIGQKAWQRYLETGSVEQVFAELRSNADWTGGAYAARFPGMAELRKSGRALTEDQYIATESAYRQAFRGYGLPSGFYDDPSDFAKLITADVSPKELDDRLQYASQVVAQDPRGQALRDELSRLYGMDNAHGLSIAYWIDPDKGADLIKKQYLAGQTAAASDRAGFGTLTLTQAETVAGTGVDPAAAQDTFAQLAGLHELNTGLVGDAGDSGVSKDEMLNAAFTSDSAAQDKLKKSQRRRTAAFEGGGGYAAGQGGVSGLGSAAN